MKKLLCFFMAMNIAFVNVSVYASTATGGWSQTDVIRQGATSLYNGIKRDGETVMRGVAKFTPTVSMVSKAIVRGGAVGAVLTAVEVLINTTQVELIQEGNQHYFRSRVGMYCTMDRKNCFADKSAAENYAKRIWSEGSWAEYAFQRCETDVHNKDILMCKFAKGNDVRVTAFVIDRPKVTVEAVAGQVITDANSGSTDARRYVGTVADAEVTQEDKVRGWNETAVSANPADTTGVNAGAGEGANAGAGEGANTGAGEGAENPPKENNPPIAPPAPKPFELPTFCGWASTVCDFVNWVKSEPEYRDEKLDIEQVNPVQYEHRDYMRFGSHCAFGSGSKSIDFGSVGGFNMSYDLSVICDYAKAIRPYVIGIGHLGALLFLLFGIRTHA